MWWFSSLNRYSDICLHHLLVVVPIQGYGSLDRKGTLFDDWDLKEVGVSETSEVCFFFPLYWIFTFHQSLIFVTSSLNDAVGQGCQEYEMGFLLILLYLTYLLDIIYLSWVSFLLRKQMYNDN